MTDILTRAPDWATHKALFCGIVPVWYADEDDGEGCKLVGRTWLADRVLMPIVATAFSMGAAIFDWEVWPIKLTEQIAGPTHD